MPKRRKQERVLLDWFNVSYRTLLLAALGLAVVGGGAALYLLGYFSPDSSPRGQAFAAITEAERLFSEAAVHGEGELQPLRDEARDRLETARAAFGATNYSDAMQAALASRNASMRLLARAGGDSGVPDVQFYKVEGNVQVKAARELIWRNATKTTTLKVGDQIKTDSTASAQIIYFNGTITTVKPGSILEIKELYDNPATRVQKVRENLRTGELVSSTQEASTAGSFHEVSTGNASVRASEQSEFETRFDEVNGTSVGVYQGAALVRSADREVQLGGRQSVSVEAPGRLGETMKLPPAPELLEPIDQKIFNVPDEDVQGLRVELVWESLGLPGTYRLQVSSGSLFGELKLDRPGLSRDRVMLPLSEPGSYYWRVAFRGAQGIEGPFSETRKFKVLAGRILNADDTTPPQLSIDDFLVFSSQVIVRGRTEPGAILAANGKLIDVGDDGSFTTIIQLRREGRNTIRFVAQDSAGNESAVERVAEVRSL
ncbi:MAG: FecR domain-containing protein [Acidobacteriota bacterium]|jgi:hypothetical protein